MANRRIGQVDIEPAHQHLIQDILFTHLPETTKVWVFGSRVGGDAKRFSDLDLALEDEEPLRGETLVGLKEALSQALLPYRVDVIDLNSASATFRDIVLRQRVLFPPIGSRD